MWRNLIRIKVESRIQGRIKVKSRIRILIRIKVKSQMRIRHHAAEAQPGAVQAHYGAVGIHNRALEGLSVQCSRFGSVPITLMRIRTRKKTADPDLHKNEKKDA